MSYPPKGQESSSRRMSTSSFDNHPEGRASSQDGTRKRRSSGRRVQHPGPYPIPTPSFANNYNLSSSHSSPQLYTPPYSDQGSATTSSSSHIGRRSRSLSYSHTAFPPTPSPNATSPYIQNLNFTSVHYDENPTAAYTSPSASMQTPSMHSWSSTPKQEPVSSNKDSLDAWPIESANRPQTGQNAWNGEPYPRDYEAPRDPPPKREGKKVGRPSKAMHEGAGWFKVESQRK